MADILVVDDDQSIATAFQHFLSAEGHHGRFASNAEEALALVTDRQPDLVFMDVRMPGVDGLEALRRIRQRYPTMNVVIMTAWGTSQTSIDAIRAGAFDYLTKPMDLDELRSVIGKAIAAARLRDAAEASASDEIDHSPRPTLVGDSPGMAAVYKMIGRLATNDVPALIVGERGTGKRLVCATIHDNSARRDAPFVSLACEALPGEVIEASLFGAQGGTIELANVEALPKAIQARLADALRDDRAAAATGRLTARVLASTTSDLSLRAREGAFSWPLYETLSIITLRLPALRERREDNDIPLLVQHFIQRFNEVLNRSIRGVDERVLKRLREHTWPGNVGELERVIKRACIVAKSAVITTDDLGNSLTDSRFAAREDVEGALSRATRAALQERLVASDRPADESLFHEIVDIVESTLVAEALTITNNNQVKAAELLGVNRATLRKKARREAE